MPELFSVVKTLVDIFGKDALLQSKSPAFEVAVKDYITQTSLLSKPYQHHRALSANEDQLISRFRWESILYRVVLGVLEEIISLSHPSINVSNLYPNKSNLFSWYQIGDDAKRTLKTAITSLQGIIFSEFILELSEICGQLLAQYSTRTTGEFYTPRSLAKHLIEISGLKDDEILGDISIIDPSCGGGIILLTIATSAVHCAIEENHSPQSTINRLVDNLYGYDIQPFAIDLTQMLLLATCVPLYALMSNPEYSAFSNVQLFDPLSRPPDPKYKYIIGNPPYLPVKRNQIDFISDYDAVINGHVNLYALFLWWAVLASSDDGIISYLVPQTLLSGLYFQELRMALYKNTRIRAITRMTDRKGVVGDADQQVMAVCFEKCGHNDPRIASDVDKLVNVIVTHNGVDIAKCSPTSIPSTSIAKMFNTKPVWIVSDNQIDYDIQEIIERQLKTTIHQLSPELLCKNGGFVWNQHPEAITEIEGTNTLPLISSGAVSSFRFSFPYLPNNPQHKRTYVKQSDTDKENVYSAASMLLHRVTPRKTGRRLIAAMVSETFMSQYPTYLVENHVNVISSDNSDLLFGITAWINSDLSQFLFQMRNGNAQISIHELHSLPCGRDVLLQLAPISRQLSNATGEEYSKLLLHMNSFLFDHFALTPSQVARVSIALSDTKTTD